MRISFPGTWLDEQMKSNRKTTRNAVAVARATKSEPGADRGPRAGSPRGVMVATGSNCQLGLVLPHFLRRSELYVESMTRSLPLPVLNLSTH